MSAESAMERSRARRQQSQRDALAELEQLEERAQEVAHNQKSRPDASTAAAKWEFAHCVAAKVPCIEAWGSGSELVVGAYMYVPPVDRAAEATAIRDLHLPNTAVYRCVADPETWLYVTRKGYWTLGGAESKEHRDQVPEWRSCLRSAEAVQPGVLPHMTEKWEVMIGSEFRRMETMGFWLRETIQVEWQKLRVSASENPVMRVHGVHRLQADGLFDYMPKEGEKGQPPAFQHQRFKNSWMYLGMDQRWWIGDTQGKNRRAPGGVAKTAYPAWPGQHPGDQENFKVLAKSSWEDRVVQVTTEPDELRACDKWAEARRQGRDLEFWGSTDEHGLFAFEGAGDAAEPPVYRFEKDPSVVLFVHEDDGRWWLGTERKNGKMIGGRFRSADPVEPGTLPDEVTMWDEMEQKEWKPRPSISLQKLEGVKASWRQARAQVAKNPVIYMGGSPADLDYDGLYDYMEEVGEPDAAPCFLHQIDGERWLYLGQDSCWWIGTKDQMLTRSSKGTMRSHPVQPGELPVGDVAWEAWIATKRHWEEQSTVTFVFSS